MWELQDRRKEVDSSSVVAIAQLGGIRTAGWHGDAAAPIKLIFWARLGVGLGQGLVAWRGSWGRPMCGGHHAGEGHAERLRGSLFRKDAGLARTPGLPAGSLVAVYHELPQNPPVQSLCSLPRAGQPVGCFPFAL